jgi:hypothetical protein
VFPALANASAKFSNYLDQVIRAHQQGYESRESVEVYGDIRASSVTIRICHLPSTRERTRGVYEAYTLVIYSQAGTN